MTSPGPRQPNARVRLMAWLRGQSWVRGIYRALPQTLREGGLRLLTRRLQARTRFPRTEAWTARVPAGREVVAPVVPADPSLPGVNVIGYLHGQFGLAEAARSYVHALVHSAVPVALLDVDLDLPHARAGHGLDAYMDDQVPHGVSIIFINPDYLARALEQVGQARLQGRHLIACWFWELEQIPERWMPALDLVDEVLVATAFVEQAVKRVTCKPVLRVPMPLGTLKASCLQRPDFGLPDDAFVFLVSFDFSSLMARKNPEASILAFQRAFARERADVRLLVKTSNGHRFPHLLQHLLQLAGDDERILIRDEVIEREHLHALYHCCDAYVSLHRAEGFGLGMAECMSIGKPVVATAWSGNMEFMDADSAALVGYTLIPLRDGEYPGGEGQRWADPDVDEAASWMRRLADEPALAKELGLRGQAKIQGTLSGGLAASRIVARLEQIRSKASQHENRDNDVEVRGVQ